MILACGHLSLTGQLKDSVAVAVGSRASVTVDSSKGVGVGVGSGVGSGVTNGCCVDRPMALLGAALGRTALARPLLQKLVRHWLLRNHKRSDH
jgi:hypothetical protein